MAYYSKYCTKVKLKERDIELLIEAHSNLIHSIIHSQFKYMTDIYSYDEIYQIGLIGLFKAIEGFDPSKGFAFSTYAYRKIQGEIYRFNRDDNVWTLNIPRRLQVLRNKYIQLKSKKDLTLEEYAKELNVNVEELEEIENKACYFIPLDSYIRQGEDKDIPLIEVVEDSSNFEEEMTSKLELETKLNLLKSKIPKTNYEILLKYHRDGFKQNEIAKEFGLTQPQVSRIIRNCKKEALKINSQYNGASKAQ